MKVPALLLTGFLIIFSGCVGEPPEEGPTYANCEEYCLAKGKPACTGVWNITGTLPECQCGFLCEKQYYCIDSQDCPEGMSCFYSRFCELVDGGGMRCGEQLGDLLCHIDCETDDDCSGLFSKCSEVTLWEGDKSETKKLCLEKDQENMTQNGTLTKAPDKIILPVRPGDVMFFKTGVLPYNATATHRSLNDGIDFELETGKGVFAVADGRVSSISTDKETGGKLLTIHHSLGQSAFDATYGGDFEPVVRGGDEVVQGEIVGLIKANGTTGFLHFELLDQFTHLPRCPEGYFSLDAKTTLLDLIANSTYVNSGTKNRVCN